MPELETPVEIQAKSTQLPQDVIGLSSLCSDSNAFSLIGLKRLARLGGDTMCAEILELERAALGETPLGGSPLGSQIVRSEVPRGMPESKRLHGVENTTAIIAVLSLAISLFWHCDNHETEKVTQNVISQDTSA